LQESGRARAGAAFRRRRVTIARGHRRASLP
jgi:hypothetical protein